MGAIIWKKGEISKAGRSFELWTARLIILSDKNKKSLLLKLQNQP